MEDHYILLVLFIRLQYSATYVDAAYCYQLSSMVCQSVTVVTNAKTAAELIEMPFGLWTWVNPKKHVLIGVHTGVAWRISLNHPCVGRYGLVVKLL